MLLSFIDNTSSPAHSRGPARKWCPLNVFSGFELSNRYLTPGNRPILKKNPGFGNIDAYLINYSRK